MMSKYKTTQAVYIVSLLVLGVTVAVLPVSAVACTVTVTAPSSIQAVVDANPGTALSPTVICLVGTFNQSVVFGPEDTFITLDGQGSAVLDGTGLTTVDGIRLLTGASDVTIKELEIRFYSGTGNGQGNGIQAWNCGTKNIEVKGNNIHDNTWNAILVGNDGGGLHQNWEVKENTVTNNGFYNIELTNAINSQIKKNVVSGPGGSVQAIGILLQARHFDAGDPVCSSHAGTHNEIVVSGNKISENTVSGFVQGTSGGGEGIRLLTFAGSGKTAKLTDTKVSENQVHNNDRYGILVFNFNSAGFGTGVLVKSDISENNVYKNGLDGIRFIDGDDSKVMENTVTANGRHGIRLGAGGTGSGSTGNKIKENTATGNNAASLGGFDLTHDSTSTPNTWKENICGTKSGADIPSC